VVSKAPERNAGGRERDHYVAERGTDSVNFGEDGSSTVPLWDNVDGTMQHYEVQMAAQLYSKLWIYKCSACAFSTPYRGNDPRAVRPHWKSIQQEITTHKHAEMREQTNQSARGGTTTFNICTACGSKRSRKLYNVLDGNASKRFGKQTGSPL
jgi:hypothetical protein